MTAGDIIGQIQKMDFENQRLKAELDEARANKLNASKFYAAAVGVELVSILHGVHPDTVRKYVSLGLIEKHPDSTDGKILIRASVALLLDFSELRKSARVLAYNR